MVQSKPPIGNVSREVIEFVVRKYVEATGQQPNVFLRQEHDQNRKCWTLTIELTEESLLDTMMREKELR